MRASYPFYNPLFFIFCLLNYMYMYILCCALPTSVKQGESRCGGLFWWVSYFSNRYPTFSLLSQLSWLPHLSLWNNRKQEGGSRCLYTQKNKRSISGQREHGARTEEQWMKPMFIILGWMAVAWGTVFYPLLLILLIIIIASPSFISHIFCSPFSITTSTLHPSQLTLSNSWLWVLLFLDPCSHRLVRPLLQYYKVCSFLLTHSLFTISFVHLSPPTPC